MMNRSKVDNIDIEIHQHAVERMVERGVSEKEVIDTVALGEMYPVKYERIAFKRNFEYNREWMGKEYKIKQVEVIVVIEEEKYVVVTVISRYFQEIV